ncbi:MAG: hypothetical protein U0326_26410 [Polyangiales bacterium]
MVPKSTQCAAVMATCGVMSVAVHIPPPMKSVPTSGRSQVMVPSTTGVLRAMVSVSLQSAAHAGTRSEATSEAFRTR